MVTKVINYITTNSIKIKGIKKHIANPSCSMVTYCSWLKVM